MGYADRVNWLFLRGLSREQRDWGDFPETFERRVGGRVYFLDLPGTVPTLIVARRTRRDGARRDVELPLFGCFGTPPSLLGCPG
jgi:hypothetical protein